LNPKGAQGKVGRGLDSGTYSASLEIVLSLNRREFLQTAAAGLGAGVLSGGLRAAEEPGLLAGVTPRGIPTTWVGAVTPMSAIVKAKLPPGARARLLVQDINGDEFAFAADPVISPQSCVATFSPRGLMPDRNYSYHLEVEGRPSIYPPGIFRTFPETGVAVPVRFAFGSCARTGSEHAVFETIRRRGPQVMLHLGDMHYENITRNDPRMYRAAWDTVLSSATQGPLYREVPVAYVWDDHDFGPNDADARAPGSPAARLVYREYAPHYPLAAGDGPAAIYHAFSLARVRFIMTDSRGERSSARTLDGPGKTLLGAAQKAWLKRELSFAAKSHAMVFWISSVPWLGEHGSDSWQAYEDERREMANFVAEHDIRNLCILCGDAHMLAADDGQEMSYADAGGPPIPVLHGSALDQGGSIKGGPYSHGTYAPKDKEGCFGWVEVEDDARGVRVKYTGCNQDEEVKVALSFEVG
jgi:phosphodiesterase/alkaline phosphatase D-like protein